MTLKSRSRSKALTPAYNVTKWTESRFNDEESAVSIHEDQMSSLEVMANNISAFADCLIDHFRPFLCIMRPILLAINLQSLVIIWK